MPPKSSDLFGEGVRVQPQCFSLLPGATIHTRGEGVSVMLPFFDGVFQVSCLNGGVPILCCSGSRDIPANTAVRDSNGDFLGEGPIVGLVGESKRGSRPLLVGFLVVAGESKIFEVPFDRTGYAGDRSLTPADVFLPTAIGDALALLST